MVRFQSQGHSTQPPLLGWPQCGLHVGQSLQPNSPGPEKPLTPQRLPGKSFQVLWQPCLAI